jgi:hypothetical protein
MAMVNGSVASIEYGTHGLLIPYLFFFALELIKMSLFLVKSRLLPVPLYGVALHFRTGVETRDDCLDALPIKGII